MHCSTLATAPKLPEDVNAGGAERADDRPVGQADITTIDDPAADAVAKDIVDQLTPLIPPENVSKVGMIVGETIREVRTHHSGPLPQAGDLAA